MKLQLRLQGKLVLPSLLTLLILMTLSAFVLSHLVINQMEENTRNMLGAGNMMMARNIANAAESYKQTILSLTTAQELRNLADAFSPDGNKDADTLQKAQRFISQGREYVKESLPQSHPNFISSEHKTPSEVNVLFGQNAEAMSEASRAVSLLSDQMKELNMLMGEMRN